MQINGRCLKKLVQIVPGQSVQDRIIDLKARNNSRDAFVAMLSNPKKLTEGRFEQLELNSFPVQVVADLNTSTKSQLQKIPAIFNFILSADH